MGTLDKFDKKFVIYENNKLCFITLWDLFSEKQMIVVLLVADCTRLVHVYN